LDEEDEKEGAAGQNERMKLLRWNEEELSIHDL